MDQKTRLSYGVSGDHFTVLKGGIIEVSDENGVVRKLDLTKGECKIRKASIPDPYEG